jgi:hypothetical protein
MIRAQRLSLFFLLIISCFLFETTVWFSWVGSIPSPNLWTPILVYLIINRESSKRLGWLATFYLLLLTCTVALPLQTLLALCSTLFIIRFVQTNFSTLSIFDLVLFSAGAMFTFPVLYAFIDFMVTSQFHFDLIYHILSLLISFPLIPGVLLLCRKIDNSFSRHTNDNLVLEI